ncbi:MAG TPA: SHOCT domain-containing protein [Dehalococcoidia bacterium]|jgi:putative membrane protein|nr:SHOCT domain-containing protein [Dehalococcoidia bacterium]
MWHSDDGMGWWMLFGGVLFTLFWISILWLFLQSAWAGVRPDKDDSPLQIAKRRYARGEITRDQFEELRRDLT